MNNYMLRDYMELKSFFPDYKESTFKLSEGFEIGVLIRPNEVGNLYEVHFAYRNRSPRVWVYGLNLTTESAKRIPHHYEYNDEEDKLRICLYYPYRAGIREYTSKMRYVKTIVPWTYEWLYHYEWYQMTGKWYGKGAH